jgi:K+-sensing histidine kinase KdpD
VIDCTVFYVGLLSPDRDDVEIMLMMDSGHRYPSRRVALAGSQLIRQMMATRQPIVRDTGAELVEAARLVTDGQFRPQSVLFVPMAVGERVLGVVSAQSYGEHAYGPDDVLTLQSLANQAAVAIENARLYDQARVWISELEAVQELGMNLNRLQSISDIVRSVAGSIEALLPFDAYRIMLIEEETQDLVPVAFGSALPEYNTVNLDNLRVRLGEGVTGWSASIGEPLLSGDAAAHPKAATIPGSPVIDESMLVAPMRRDRVVLGVITLSKLGLNQYRPEHLRLLQIFSDHAAAAMSNARLFATEQQRVNKLKELDQLRKDFVSTVTHELRTPLTSILGFTETLQHYWTRLAPSRQKDMVHKVEVSAKRLQRLVEDLLVASRIDSGVLSLSLSPMELAPQIHQAVVEIAAKFQGQRIIQDGPTAPLFVQADAQRVQQIVVNLLDNAAKYSPEGSPIAVRWTADGDFAVVEVQDAGPGIEEEAREMLFTRFGKLAQTARAGHVGTGLGLFISRQLVEAMGGTIWVESQLGCGSRFVFKLPMTRSAFTER